MKITIKEARKLFKELQKKFPKRDCSIEIVFSSWSKEHLAAYVSGPDYSSIKRFNTANEVRNYFGL